MTEYDLILLSSVGALFVEGKFEVITDLFLFAGQSSYNLFEYIPKSLKKQTFIKCLTNKRVTGKSNAFSLLNFTPV